MKDINDNSYKHLFTRQVTEEPLILGKAKVISIDDPDKKGRVQVRLIPEMEDAKEAHLPWYDPYIGTGNNTTQKFNPPLEGSVILVYSSGTTKRSGYYIFEDHIQGFFDATKVSSKLSSIADTTYKDLHYRLLASGNILYENRSTKETGILHNSGSYIIFDSSGNIILNGKGNKLKVYNTTVNLKEILTDIQGVVSNVVSVGSFVDAEARPVVYNFAGTDIPIMSAVLTKINNLLL